MIKMVCMAGVEAGAGVGAAGAGVDRVSKKVAERAEKKPRDAGREGLGGGSFASSAAGAGALALELRLEAAVPTGITCV